MDRAGKQQIIKDVSETFAEVVSVVLADFRGLDVATVTGMRHEFQKAGCGYQVIKNTLLKLAMKDSPMEPMSHAPGWPDRGHLVERVALGPGQAGGQVRQGAEGLPDQGRLLRRQMLDVAGVENLSRLPGKDECQASCSMTFLAAPTDLVRTLAAGPRTSSTC